MTTCAFSDSYSQNARSVTIPAREYAWARTFALEGKLLGCFCEVHSPLFSFRPLTLIALSNAAVRSEIYWRFISGFCPIRSNQGRSGQIGHYMQIAQSRINTGDFASC